MKDKHDNKTIDAFKPQPMTNAERQRKYRQKQKDESAKRIDLHVDLSIYNMLDSLALYGNESMKEVLVRLIESEYTKQLNAKDRKFDTFLKDLLSKVTV